MVATEIVVEKLLAERLIYIFLLGVVWITLIVRPERAVECELFIFYQRFALIFWVTVWCKQRRLLGCWVHADQAFCALILLYYLLVLQHL